MNFKKQAHKLEQFLEEEFKNKVPIIVLKDGSVVYKMFKVKKNHTGNWNLSYIHGDAIDTFKMKATAILAAKFYSINKIDIYNNIKNLDTAYWTNSFDSVVFKERYTKSNDDFKKNMYFSRWELTNSRASNYKEQIIRMFTHNFG
jgi:hypothetical protein